MKEQPNSALQNKKGLSPIVLVLACCAIVIVVLCVVFWKCFVVLYVFGSCNWRMFEHVFLNVWFYIIPLYTVYSL